MTARSAILATVALVLSAGCRAHAPATAVERPTTAVERSATRWAEHPEPDLASPESETGEEAPRSTEPRAEAKQAERRHVVQPGQTLYRISVIYGVPLEALAKRNGIVDPRTLSVGQTVVVPASPGTGASGPSSEPAGGARARIGPPSSRAHAPRPQPAIGSGKGIFDWPLRGVLYARFGRKGQETHDGIDLAAPLKTPVRTAGEGKVLFAGEQKGYGRIVIVEHDDGFVTLYAHNHDLRVKTGQRVRRGQVIATVGESGRTSGPHLHFEVRRNGRPVDPILYLGPVPRR